MWDTAKRPAADPTPMRVRREMAKVLVEHGHAVTLMEDDPDREGEASFRSLTVSSKAE
jgi:Trk K+ transport system NAD-binding subunit